MNPSPDDSNRLRRADRTPVAPASLTYVFDAQCPWCHAVTPTVRAAAERRRDMRVDVVHGRLLSRRAPLGTVSWYAPTVASVRGLTRAIFGHAFGAAVDDGSTVADSDASAAAFVAMRSIAPDLAFEIATALHTTWFADGRSLADVDTVLDVAAGLGLSTDRTCALLGNPLVGRLVQVEQACAAASGVTGLPALLLRVDGQDVPIATRLRTVEQVVDTIEDVLAGFPDRQV